MVWIVIEALFALFVLLGIIGWTMRVRRPEPPAESLEDGSAAPPPGSRAPAEDAPREGR